MNNIDDLLYQAGLTAQGCWDSMDNYDQTAILKLCELVVKECILACPHEDARQHIRRHFGVK
jgi:hypothetical protein